MNRPEPQPHWFDLRSAYVEACALDVQAFKPGNVSQRSNGHGMQAADFLRSAMHSAGPIAAPGLALGERIRRAVVATREAVGCNTNLGILLLCAPLLQAGLEYPELDLSEGVRRVLDATTLADTEAVFEAIRLAAPAGLGRRARHDVTGPAELALKPTMALAAEVDRIARQYATAYREMFDELLPYLRQALQRRDRREPAMIDLYLHILAAFPDSHIRRKHGEASAVRVQRLAAEARVRLAGNSDPVTADHILVELDLELKQAGLNPGTSADLCVAAFLIHRLQSQAANPAGATRHKPRTDRPTEAEAPHLTTSR